MDILIVIETVVKLFVGPGVFGRFAALGLYRAFLAEKVPLYPASILLNSLNALT